MNGSISLRALQGFFKKHHPVIFIAVVLLLISGAVFSLYLVTEQALGDSDPPANISANFDKETIDKIKKLHDSSDSTADLEFPSPRSNPFIEK